MAVVKSAKGQSGKTKIINVIDEGALKEINHKKSLKGLFDDEEEDEEELANIHRHHQHSQEHGSHDHHEHTHHDADSASEDSE